MKTVMFVCMANICRSPALMAVFNHMAAQKNLPLHADSSGIGWVHLGERSSHRIFEAAKKHGVIINHRTQQFEDTFFGAYDLILAVNEDILEQLKLRNPTFAHKVHLATEFSVKYKGNQIPDPYYLSENGFDDVLDMIEDCCAGLIMSLSQ